MNRKSEIEIRLQGIAALNSRCPISDDRNGDRTWPGTAKARGLTPPGSLDAMSNYWRARRRLLEFDRGAGSFQILLELGSVVLRSRFLHDATGLGEVLGFLQAEAGDGADGLDDVDLLVASGLEDDVELGLLFDSGGGRAGSSGNRSGSRDAEGFFDSAYQFHNFHQGLGLDGFDDLVGGQGGHGFLPSEMVSVWKVDGIRLRPGLLRRRRRRCHPAGRPRP